MIFKKGSLYLNFIEVFSLWMTTIQLPFWGNDLH